MEFENFLLRLVETKGGYKDARRYGTPGQPQQGIDIRASLSSDRYHCWQAKNTRLGPAGLKGAIDKFIGGSWFKDTKKFTLCIREGIGDAKLQDEIKAQRRRLAALKIEFEVIDGTDLTRELRKHREVACEFFHEMYVDLVLGKAPTATQLHASKVQLLKQKLYDCYHAHFRDLDVSFSLSPSAHFRDIREHFVQLDVGALSSFTDPPTENYVRFSAASQFATANNSDTELDDLLESVARHVNQSDGGTQAPERISLDDWVDRHSRQLLLASGGFGKSTALRCLALDLLSRPIRFPRAADRLKDCIPLLIPFSLWARLTAEEKRKVGLKEVAHRAYDAYLEHSEIDALIEHAQQNKQLLLMIDGLDECSDEQTAVTTLHTICTYVQMHELMAIFTSRSAAAQRLRDFGTDWRVARLHELTPTQQRSFVDAVNPRVSADHFFHDLEQAHPLRTLASTPLLLSGLLAVWSRDGKLPPTRVELFETLVEQLLDVQPKRRATAAGHTRQKESSFSKEPSVRTRALSKLAFEMQQSRTPVSISRNEATQIVERFLASRQGAGWNPERAKDGAYELIEGDTEITGSLLERISEQIAFRHAAFREHLAGKELASWPLRRQCEFAPKHADDPQWRVALLTLTQSQQSTTRLEMLLSSIRGNSKRMPDTLERRLLLAEIVFTVGHEAGDTADFVANDAFDRIEDGLIEAERLQTLELALDSPKDGPIGDALANRMCRWWPCLTEYREETFRVFADWTPQPDLRRTLWIGLRDRYEIKYLAAAALAKVFASDRALERELHGRLNSAHDHETAAAALHALLLGWPHPKKTEQLIRSALASESDHLRAVGALASFRRGERTGAVRDILAQTIRGDCDELSDDAAKALEIGWPRDSFLKQRYWDSLRGTAEPDQECTTSYALAELVRMGPRSRQLGDWAQEQFSKQVPLDVADLVDCADSLRKLVKANGTARAAIEQWLATHDNNLSNKLRAAMIPVLRSEQVKGLLLQDLKRGDSGRFDAVDKLLEGWGPRDREVRTALTQLLSKPTSELTHVAHHLPRIIADPNECRTRLLEMAGLRNSPPLDRIIKGFQLSHGRSDDAAAVSALLPHLSLECNAKSTSAFIKCFHKDSRVKELALALLDRHDCPLSTIAEKYEDDPRIRAKLLARAAPLSPYLRRRIAARAAQRFDDPVLFRTLQQHGSECDEEAASLATVGYCKAMAAQGADTSQLCIDLLHHLTRRERTDWYVRAPALAGVIALGELKRVLEPDTHIEVVALHDTATTVTGLLAQHWEEVERKLGKHVLKRLCYTDPGGSLFWRRFSPHVAQSPALRDYFLRHCEGAPALGEYEITTLARLYPRSDLLLQACCRALRTPRPSARHVYDRYFEHVDHARSIATAARILAAEFSSNDASVAALERAVDLCGRWQDEGTDIPFIGLAAAWPEHRLVKKQAARVRSRKHLDLTFGGALWVASKHFDASEFALHALEFLGRRHARGWDFASDALAAIRARLIHDFELRGVLLLYVLQFHDEASICASIPQLLATTEPLDEYEQRWVRYLLMLETRRAGIRRFGLDATVNRLRPVLQCLSDSLQGATESGARLPSRAEQRLISQSVK